MVRLSIPGVDDLPGQAPAVHEPCPAPISSMPPPAAWRRGSPGVSVLGDLLGIEWPVIQAPMAGVQGSALALAVSNAGGLGSLPGAMLTPEALLKELLALRNGTERPYNVNFFCHRMPPPDAAREAAWRALLSPHLAAYGIDAAAIASGPGRMPFDDTLADVLEAFKPPVVSFHFGLPEPALLARVKGWGAKVLSSATSVDEGLWLQAHGADAVIAQGLEAGGHRGHFLSGDLEVGTHSGLFALLPQMVQALRVPVIAAGGVTDARAAAAARALGAAGVQAGTAYLLCPEATTSAVHRAALQSGAAVSTALTNVFTGRPARSIVNTAMRELGPMNPQAPAFPGATAAMAPLRAAAEALGRSDWSPLWAGQNASGCRAVPAAQITRDIAAAWRPQGIPR